MKINFISRFGLTDFKLWFKGWVLTFPSSAGSVGQVLTTDGTGQTSWSSVGSDAGFVPTYLVEGESWVLPENKQAVFATDIYSEGELIVDGILIEV